MATYVTPFASPLVAPAPAPAPSGQDIPRRAFPQRLLMRTTTKLSKGARRNAFFVAVSLVYFRVWWLAFFAVHSLCICYFALFSFIYWVLPDSYTGLTLQNYAVTMPMTRFPVVAICHALVALGHAFFLLRMVLSSLYHRRFTFGRTGFRMPKPDDARQQSWRSYTFSKKALHALHRLNALYTKMFSRRGLFGIEGKYFDVLFIARELLESSLQSMQAHRMSRFVPRVMLNRFYVGVIVVNCFCSPAVQFLYAANPPLARLVCLVLDILLDFVSSVAIPIALVLPYSAQFDVANSGFDFMLWYNDLWLVNMINEFKLLFVSSWTDLVARIFFSVSLLVSLQSVKSLLRKVNRRINPGPSSAARGHPGAPDRSAALSSFVSDDHEPADVPASRTSANRWLSYPPFIQQIAMSVNRKLSSAPAMRDTSSSVAKSMITVPPTAVSRKLAKVSHALFSFWGLGVLVLHLRGEFQKTPPECVLSVRPWFSSKAACSLVQINCQKLNVACTLREMDAILSEIDPDTLAHIVIRHCPSVEISPRIQDFAQLVGLKIYNSTLARWGHEAALTHAHHPRMVFLFLVRVNMSTFPDGLLSDAFPQHLYDVEFSGTNLTTVPDNLDQKWPTRGGNVNCFEQSSLERVPPVIERMRTGFLSLVSNRITEIPSYIFTNDKAITIWLSDNPIATLPRMLVPSLSIRAVHLANTALRTLPAWMDDQFFSRVFVELGGSPICDDLLASADGSASSASGNGSSEAISAVARAAFASGVLDCGLVSGDYMTYYPSVTEAQLDDLHAVQ